jgi:hypothetical protein
MMHRKGILEVVAKKYIEGRTSNGFLIPAFRQA